MKIYKTQSEVEKDIKNGVLVIDDDVTFECSISIDASIYAGNIKAHNIDALNIDAYDINAGNIRAGNIDAGNINAYDINAGNIDAVNIDANDIKANDINTDDINAGNIDAGNISYYAFCFSYNSIKCSSIEARRENHSEPICLDGKLEIKDDTQETIKIGDQIYNKQEVEEALKNVKSIK